MGRLISGLEEIPLVPIKTAVVWLVVLQIYQNYNKKLTYSEFMSCIKYELLLFSCEFISIQRKSEEFRSRKCKFLLSALCSFVFVFCHGRNNGSADIIYHIFPGQVNAL